MKIFSLRPGRVTKRLYMREEQHFKGSFKPIITFLLRPRRRNILKPNVCGCVCVWGENWLKQRLWLKYRNAIACFFIVIVVVFGVSR